jgi:magnesium chelatase family protein
MNPSPSGFFDPDSPQTSSPHEMQRYLSKILDRIDIHIEVTPVPFENYQTTKAESSVDIRKETAARAIRTF